MRTLALITTFGLFTNFSSALGAEVLAANAVLLQVVTLSAYFIDGFAFATESVAGIAKGQGSAQKLTQLLRLAGISSLAIGLTFAITFILLPRPLFSLLTHHVSILDRITQDVIWLLPVLGFGSIAYFLDGYFLGLTAGQILRQSTLLSALFGFLPSAFAAWYLQNPLLLWLALSLFMAGRALVLGVQVPQTLRNPQSSQN